MPRSRNNLLLTLAVIVQRSNTRAGRLFDVIVVGLICAVVVIISVESMPGLPAPVYALLRTFELAITVLFAVEYALRIYTAPHRGRYIFSFFGIVDLLAILPLLLWLNPDFATIRLLRLLRVAKILKLARYNKAMRRYHQALKMAKEEIVIFLLTVFALAFLASCGIYYFEHEMQPDKFKSIPHSFWWAMITITTVGYGDIVPATAGGKALTIFLMLITVCIIAVPAGVIASTFTSIKEDERQHADRQK